jgi:hypothetical protein
MSLSVYLIEEGWEGFSANITNNLTTMAEAADVYYSVWRPEEIGITHARHLIRPLESGIAWLALNREGAKELESDNGWGKYDDFLPWLQDYLQACREHPNARVEVSR